MKRIFIRIMKPSGAYARWFLFLALAAIAYASAEGHLRLVKKYFDSPQFSLEVGDYDLTLWVFLRSAITIILLFWTAAVLHDFAEGRIRGMKKMRVSTRNLLLKILQIGIYFIAFMLTFDILGINLTTLAVFSGAIGIGLGFGLQKISSNFVSGLILALERSIKLDDLVELQDGTSGYVRKSGARYTLLEIGNGKEMMIPNDDFITSRVINWTYTNTRCRVDIPVRVSYNSDIEKARDLIVDAAHQHPACLPDPAPVCLLTHFGESSVDFMLHFWIADVRSGRGGPQNDVMFDIWRKFKENDIAIPYPQREIHIREPLSPRKKAAASD